MRWDRRRYPLSGEVAAAVGLDARAERLMTWERAVHQGISEEQQREHYHRCGCAGYVARLARQHPDGRLERRVRIGTWGCGLVAACLPCSRRDHDRRAVQLRDVIIQTYGHLQGHYRHLVATLPAEVSAAVIALPDRRLAKRLRSAWVKCLTRYLRQAAGLPASVRLPVVAYIHPASSRDPLHAHLHYPAIVVAAYHHKGSQIVHRAELSKLFRAWASSPAVHRAAMVELGRAWIAAADRELTAASLPPIAVDAEHININDSYGRLADVGRLTHTLRYEGRDTRGDLVYGSVAANKGVYSALTWGAYLAELRRRRAEWQQVNGGWGRTVAGYGALAATVRKVYQLPIPDEDGPEWVEVGRRVGVSFGSVRVGPDRVRLIECISADRVQLVPESHIDRSRRVSVRAAPRRGPPDTGTGLQATRPHLAGACSQDPGTGPKGAGLETGYLDKWVLPSGSFGPESYPLAPGWQLPLVELAAERWEWCPDRQEWTAEVKPMGVLLPLPVPATPHAVSLFETALTRPLSAGAGQTVAVAVTRSARTA